MTRNPLTVPISRILHQHPRGLSEYELLLQLQSDGFDLDRSAGQEAAVSGELLLFRKHFLVMNALYQLQPVLWQEGWYLSVSALSIRLQAVAERAESAPSPASLPSPAAEQALRDYYLDWSQFEQSSSASVEALLNGFWQRYFAADKQQGALAVLGLDADCRWSEIRSAYQRQVAVHHPDKGGDSEQFRRVRDAYELLACCRN